jgi:hypothetical protein
MNILGWFLAVCGLVGVIYGLRMMMKKKKMGNVPFKKPSEIAQAGAGAADAKGLVSTEGAAQLPPQPLIAPMSGQPCIGYEITVERKWEKHVRTEKGMQKKTGSSKVHGEYRGSFFQIGDGSGAVTVDATAEPDSEYEKSHSSTVSIGMMIPGTLTFGQMQLNTPAILDTDSRTTAFVGTEKILKASPTMYALGQIAQGPQGLAIGTPKGIGTGKLIIHHQGREALAGKTHKHMILGYALGGVLFVGGTGLGLFGPKAQASTAGIPDCGDTITITKDATCEDRMYAAEGKTYTWTVTEAATYSIELKQPNVANPIDGVIEITDATGNKVAYDDGGSADKNAHVKQAFTAGTYKINVRDYAHDTVEGGYGFQLSFSKSSGGAPALPAASVAAGGSPASAATTTNAVANAAAAPAHHAGTPAAAPGAAHANAAPAPKPAKHK